jgi:hypothetical protein
MGKKRKAGIALDCDIEASAQFVSDQRTSAKTKSTYKSHLKMFVDYMSNHFPDSVADGKLVLPLTWEAVLSFNGFVASAAYARAKFTCPNDIPPDIPEPYSSSHLSGFKSAVVDVYKKAGIRIDPDLDMQWGAFLSKYFVNIFKHLILTTRLRSCI